MKRNKENGYIIDNPLAITIPFISILLIHYIYNQFPHISRLFAVLIIILTGFLSWKIIIASVNGKRTIGNIILKNKK